MSDLSMADNTVYFGDCRESMRNMIQAGIKVDCCVTSPPYFRLRSYLPDGHPDKHLEAGLEQTPDQFIAGMVETFRLVRDVLRDDGTFWLNLGDSYGKGKQLLLIPARVALALQDDGWILRSEVVWHKTRPLPESTKDRPTRSHEMLYLFAKREKYFYDWCAISEPMKENSLKRLAQNVEEQVGSTRANGGEKTNGTMKAVCFGGNKKSGGQSRLQSGNEWNQQGTRANKRDVWSIAPAGYKGAHFAVMPEKLAETCILASSRPGGIVFDPFFGSGTTGSVAIEHGRRFIGCELNRDYKPLQDERIRLAWESRHTADMNSAQLDLAGV